MFYSKEITVAANTPETSATITRVPVTLGIINEVSFRPRPGHNSLLRMKVFFHDTQLFPFERGEDLHGDTYPIEWREHIEIFTEPLELVIHTWNVDTVYEHTVDISFTILTKGEVIPFAFTQVMADMVKMFADFISAIFPQRIR